MEKNFSATLFERAKKVTPGGVQSGSRYRKPSPWYFTEANGAWLTDVDRKPILDCIMGNGAVMMGHRHPVVIEAVEATLRTGLTCGLETELSVIAAEKVAKKIPGNFQIRFVNSGTEAALHCIRIARAATGRQKIAKIEGGYDGWADPVLVSVWPDLTKAGPVEKPNSLAFSNGMLMDTVRNTLVLPFNNLEAAEQILREHKDELAAVILEPIMIDIGFVEPEVEFLKGLRKITKELGMVLIFDELLTGFRLSMGGAQQYYNIQADLVMLGKAVANGFPIAIVAGKQELLDLIQPGGSVAFQGTFNGNAISLAAVNAVMDFFDKEDVVKEIQAKTEYLQSGFREICQRHGVAAYLAGRGGHFHPYFVEKPVKDYRSAAATNRNQYKIFSDVLANKNIYFYSNPLLHHALSLAHGERELGILLEAMDEGIRCARELKA
jgi:glutamate-1-semialdehyde 2,1-aminomutase